MQTIHKLKSGVNLSLLLTLLSVHLFITVTPVSGAELHLALADSTCASMKKAGAMFTQQTNIDLKYTCKSSGLLAKGIQAGIIQADFFLSANKKWMDRVVHAGIIQKNQIEKLLANELVVVSSPASSFTVKQLVDLKSLEVTKIIIGTPDKAPFGRYAKQALEKAGIWQDIRHKITSRKNISLAIQTLEEEGDGVFGIIYRTGLKDPLLFQFAIPGTLHDPIRYYSGPIHTSLSKEGLNVFLSFLKDERCQESFRTAGFIVLP